MNENFYLNSYFDSNFRMDPTEFYRENYQDALDEIRNLKDRIVELENENSYLKERIKANKKDIENLIQKYE